MDVRYVNPFVTATTTLFDRMLGCKLERGALTLHSPKDPYRGISGIIELSGNVQATIVLNLSRELAMSASRVWLKEHVQGINANVIDVVGELVNIIVGQARAELCFPGVTMGLPRVAKEHTHFIKFPKDCKPISIPFRCDWGQLSVDVGMTAMQEAVLKE